MGGFGDYYNQTVLHPVGLVAVLVMGIAVVLLPRRFAVFPIIIIACFIPSAQRLVISGLDFDLLRILVLFAWGRLLLRNGFRGFEWNKLDTLVVAWMASGTVIFTLQYGTAVAFINRCGWMFIGLGMYFYFRCVLRDWEDLDRLFLAFILVCIPVGGAFLIESGTGRNFFSIFGGVPEFTMVREGRLRCQGAFSHPILAGCFWASVMPWMAVFYAKRRFFLATAGLTASGLIIVACASSTPVMSALCVVIGMALYPLHHQLRVIRWAFFSSLVVLHFVMNHPVWHLMCRVDISGGSTGWHRYKILDTTINNLSDWWLLGEPDPMRWGVWQMRDLTNQYVLEGLQGGLLTLLLFVSGIVVAFGIVGDAMRKLKDKTYEHFLVFCVGVSLFVHVWTFFGVSYFGQILMLWYLNLAIIGSLKAMATEAAPAQQDRPNPSGADVEIGDSAQVG